MDFPKAVWLQDYLHQGGYVPTKSGAVETIHIAHVLQQIMKGYLTGVNCNKWEMHDRKHLLYALKNGKPDNVECVFYRFEYQPGRRSLHIHMFVWLKSFSDIKVEQHFKATVPSHNVDDAHLVTRLQSSDTPVAILVLLIVILIVYITTCTLYVL